jgi:hypothetical protein
MTSAETRDQIRQAVEKELEETEYACSELLPLTGGTANFIYRGQLRQPLPDGTHEILVKHGEAYVANSPDFGIATSRCVRRPPTASQFLAISSDMRPSNTNKKL